MGRQGAFVLTASLIAAAMLLAPAQGAASQLIGSNLSGSALNSGCATDTPICTETFQGTPSLGNATSNGVITSWTLREPGTGAPQSVTLRVLRFVSPIGPTFLGVRSAQPDVFPAVVGDMTVTFPTRLPITAGDQIGFDHSTALHSCVDNTGIGDQQARWNPPLADGEQAAVRGTGLAGGNCEPPVRAAVEPDADNDGFGDETQDQCPTNASTQGPCPTPSSTSALTGQRAAALASCKKRAKKHNWSHKRLRKCKRKANLLPV